MEGGIFMLVFLSLTMLCGSFLSGLLPLTLNLAESKMRHITILGAGLLIGTALAVIIPEGIHTLYSSEKCPNFELNKDLHMDHHRHRRDLESSVEKNDLSGELTDEQKLELFLNQLFQNNNLRMKLVDRPYIADGVGEPTASDRAQFRTFMFSISKNNNIVTVDKRASASATQEHSSQLTDQQLLELFLNQLNKNNNRVRVLVKRGGKLSDQQLVSSFLSTLSSYFNLNAMPLVDDAQVEQSTNLTMLIDNETPTRHKRDLMQEKKAILERLDSELDAKPNDPKSLESEKYEEHSHSGSDAHSAIGVTLILGFVFMLLVDQIGGKYGHRSHQILDTQSIRNKITFTTTLGLIVHAAADGIALGAAAATSKTDVEMIVFFAIMLHKAPASFGLVSFLIHEGLDRSRVRKHLIIFSLSAPVLAIATFIVLKSNSTVVSTDSTGLCMLFSAGTFLYVSTVHVLPEVQSHNEDRQFKFAEMLSFIVGSIIPLFLSIGHSH